MFLKLIIRLSALSLGLSYAGCTTPQQQSQLATLHERMNQMISALYSSPLLSKVQTAATPAEEFPSTTSSQESSYSYPPAPAPQVVFVAPPSFLETGAEPTDYGHPTKTNPVQRSTWPYQYDYGYQQQFAPPVYSSPPFSSPVYPPPAYSPLYPRPQYPEYARSDYPQLPAPHSSQSPAVAYPSPLPYPSPYGSQYHNLTPFPVPICSPAFPGVPSLPAPYPPQISYLPSPYPAPLPYPSGYSPSPPYPHSPAPYPSSIPQQFAQSLQYPPPIPVPYPPPIAMPYSPSIPYPQPIYPPPPAFSKSSDVLLQPQYEYSG